MPESKNPYAAPEANAAPSADAGWAEAFPIRAEFGRLRPWLYCGLLGSAFLLIASLGLTLLLVAAHAAYLWGGSEFPISEEDLVDLPTMALIMGWNIGWTAVVVFLFGYARRVRSFSLGDENQTLEGVLASQRLVWVGLSGVFVTLAALSWLIGTYP